MKVTRYIRLWLQLGGTSVEAHQLALKRLIQAGAIPISWVQLLCEFQRDWNRKETSSKFAEILFKVIGQ